LHHGRRLHHCPSHRSKLASFFRLYKPRTEAFSQLETAYREAVSIFVGRDPSEEETPKAPKREEHGSADNSNDRSYETLVPKNEDAFPEQRWNERLHYGRRGDRARS